VVICNALPVVFSAAFIGLPGHNEIILLGMISLEANRNIGFIDDHIALQAHFVIQQFQIRWE